MIVGGYTMDVYCENEDKCVKTNTPGVFRASDSFYGRNERAAFKEARTKGWVFRKSGNKSRLDVAICPSCAKVNNDVHRTTA